MKQKTTSIIVAISTFLFLLLAGRYGFTVVKIEDVEKAAQSEVFDPVSYVDGIWDSQLIPTFDENAEKTCTKESNDGIHGKVWT